MWLVKKGKTTNWFAFDRNGHVLRVGDFVCDVARENSERRITYELQGKEDEDYLAEVCEYVDISKGEMPSEKIRRT